MAKQTTQLRKWKIEENCNMVRTPSPLKLAVRTKGDLC